MIICPAQSKQKKKKHTENVYIRIYICILMELSIKNIDKTRTPTLTEFFVPSAGKFNQIRYFLVVCERRISSNVYVYVDVLPQSFPSFLSTVVAVVVGCAHGLRTRENKKQINAPPEVFVCLRSSPPPAAIVADVFLAHRKLFGLFLALK